MGDSWTPEWVSFISLFIYLFFPLQNYVSFSDRNNIATIENPSEAAQSEIPANENSSENNLPIDESLNQERNTSTINNPTDAIPDLNGDQHTEIRTLVTSSDSFYQDSLESDTQELIPQNSSIQNGMESEENPSSYNSAADGMAVKF